MKKVKELRRKTDGDTPGVCAGLAEYFNMDVVLVRLLFVLGFIFGGGAGLLYLILWLVIPEED